MSAEGNLRSAEGRSKTTLCIINKMPKFRKFNNRKKKKGIRVPPPPPLEFPVGSAEYVRIRNLEIAQRERQKQIEYNKEQ
jgi:hypothetical protein